MDTLLRASRIFQTSGHKTLGKSSSMSNLDLIETKKIKSMNRNLTKIKEQPFSFGIGEIVNVVNDIDIVENLQMLHGRWIEDMKIILGREGVVRSISSNGDVGVEIEGVKWFFHPKCLTKESFAVGETVKMIENEIIARRLQYGMGEWSNIFSIILGKSGQIVNIFPDGSAEVFINEKSWALNPKCLVKKKELIHYKIGSTVKIIRNKDTLQMIQGTGMWKEGMDITAGKVGKVITSHSNGDVDVLIEETTWKFNYKCVFSCKRSLEKFKIGDHVIINENEILVRKIQELNQLWVEAMEVTVGKRGIVTRLYRDGSVRVEIEGNDWNFSPDCLNK